MLPVCFEGEYTKDRIPVMSSIFGTIERLKDINPRFFVMFCKPTQRFEVHVRGQQGTTLGCELPFPELDYRALDYVRERMRPVEEVARQIDFENERLDQRDTDRMLDKSSYKTKEALRWADHHPSKEGNIPKEMINDES